MPTFKSLAKAAKDAKVKLAPGQKNPMLAVAVHRDPLTFDKLIRCNPFAVVRAKSKTLGLSGYYSVSIKSAAGADLAEFVDKDGNVAATLPVSIYELRVSKRPKKGVNRESRTGRVGPCWYEVARQTARTVYAIGCGNVVVIIIVLD